MNFSICIKNTVLDNKQVWKEREQTIIERTKRKREIETASAGAELLPPIFLVSLLERT